MERDVDYIRSWLKTSPVNRVQLTEAATPHGKISVGLYASMADFQTTHVPYTLVIRNVDGHLVDRKCITLEEVMDEFVTEMNRETTAALRVEKVVGWRRTW